MRQLPMRLRGDVQGLRALAVTTVILGHAGLALPGGFVGVDVFFAISGFLITQLLLREIQRTDRISILGFYARRARRILPAATVVLVLTVLAGGLWLGAIRGPEAATDVLWAAFFAINLRLAHQGTDYFTADAPPSPVQHFWSLAVEEQFYVVWPLLIVAVLVFVRRRRERAAAGESRESGAEAAPEPVGVPLGALATAIGALTLLSLLWSVVRTPAEPAGAYFSTATRLWELGAGALAAIGVFALTERSQAGRAPLTQGGVALVRAGATLLAAAGLVAIGWSCVRYDDQTPFPGWQAAVPVLGAVAVLVAGGLPQTEGAPTPVARLLSLRPMRIVGDWSYSLYLWHWPLLVLPALASGVPLTTAERLAAVCFTVSLAGLSYRYVETPFRHRRAVRPAREPASAPVATAEPVAAVAAGSAGSARPSAAWRWVALYPATVALVITAGFLGTGPWSGTEPGTGGSIMLSGNWEQRLGTDDETVALVAASIKAARADHPVPADLEPPLAEVERSFADVGDCDYHNPRTRILCPRGDPDADRTIVVWGNSHARHWIDAFDTAGKALGYRVYYLVRVQCIAPLVTPDRVDSPEPFTRCVDFHDWAMDQIEEIRPDLTVVSTSPGARGLYDDDGGYHTDPEEVRDLLAQGYERLYDRLLSASDRTVLLEDIPSLTGSPSECLARPGAGLDDCVFGPAESHTAGLADQVASAEAAGVETVPTRQWFCHAGGCPPVIGNVLPYRDGGHMTNEYSAHLAGALAEALGLKAAS